MRLAGEYLQVLAGQPGIGNSQKFLLDLCLRGEVRIAEDRGMSRLCGDWAPRSPGKRANEISARKTSKTSGLRTTMNKTSFSENADFVT
jgi:hypothetical protein